jgi:ABC-type transport system involved in multi-copper enzyme maturation permease subunit
VNRALWKLFIIEFRRLWTVAALFIPLGFAVLSTIILALSARIRPVYDFARSAVEINIPLVVPFSAALLCAGIISTDVKEGWLRTLLIRPITRQQYLLIKLAAAFASVVISILIGGVIPNIAIGSFFAEGQLQFDLVSNLIVHGIFLLQALLVIALLFLFSCWLPGLFNIVLLTMWYIAASIIGGYLQTRFWSSQWLTIVRDFLFPNGFTSALDMVIAKAGTPVSEIAWGFASLGFVLALAFWSVTRIQVDKSSE